MVKMPIGIFILLVLGAAAMLNAENKNFFIWEPGGDSDFDKSQPAFFMDRTRAADAGTDGGYRYRALKKDVYQCPFAMPAFDFDPDNHGAIRHLFYLNIRYKDTVRSGVSVFAGKGGVGFYGRGYIGTFGGSGAGEWQEATLIIPLSMMRCLDGKQFTFTTNEITADVPVNRVILFSAAAEGLADKDRMIKEAYAHDTAQRAALKRRLIKDFTDLGMPEAGNRIEYTEAEKAKGFRYFFPPVSRQMFANSEPNAEELKDIAELCASPGEFETLIIALRAVKGADTLTIAVADCVNGSAVLKTSAVTVRLAEYNEQRAGSSWGKDYQVVPERLLPAERIPIGPDRVELCYLTVHIPEDAAAGDYTGTITLTSAKGGATAVPLNLTVYPFRMEHPDHGTHGLFYYMSYGSYDPFELADMRDHGMDMMVADFTPLVTMNPDGTVGMDEAPIKEFFAAAREYGFRPPLMTGLGSLESRTGKDPRRFGDAVRRTMELAAEGGFAEIGFFPVDEPHDEAKIKKSLELCALIKQTPGARTYITLNPKAAITLHPVLDFHCYNITYLNEETLEKPGQNGHVLMYYGPNVMTNPAPVRYTAGYYFYRTGAMAVQYFTYMEFAGDPYLDFDGPNRDWNAVFPSRTSWTHDPTVEWEALREGVDDYKYLYTLEQYIERAETAGKTAQAHKAREVLDGIMKAVSPEGNKATGPETYIEANTALKDEGVDAAKVKAKVGQADDAWYDRSRKQIAEQIVILMNAE